RSATCHFWVAPTRAGASGTSSRTTAASRSLSQCHTVVPASWLTSRQLRTMRPSTVVFTGYWFILRSPSLESGQQVAGELHEHHHDQERHDGDGHQGELGPSVEHVG